MKKNRKINVLLVFVLFLITGCTTQASSGEDSSEDTEKSQIQIQKYETEIEKLQNELKKYEQNIKDLKDELAAVETLKREELDDYKNLVTKAIEFLNDDELQELAKSLWHYEIKINGDPVPSIGEIELDQTNFEIIFSQKNSMIDILPDKIYNQGALSGEYYDHLEIEGIEPKDIKRMDGTTVTAFVYEFENLTSNMSFQINISNELKERLGLQNNTIIVRIK